MGAPRGMHELLRIYTNLIVMPSTMQTRGMHTKIRSRDTPRQDVFFLFFLFLDTFIFINQSLVFHQCFFFFSEHFWRFWGPGDMTKLKDLSIFHRVRRKTPGVRIFCWSPNSFGGGSSFGTLTFRWNWSDDTCGRTVSRCSLLWCFHATKDVIKPKDSTMNCSESITFTTKRLSPKKVRRFFVQASSPKNGSMCGATTMVLRIVGFTRFFSLVLFEQNFLAAVRRRVQPTDLWSVHHPLGRGDGKRLAHLLHWRCSVLRGLDQSWLGWCVDVAAVGAVGLPRLGLHDWIVKKVYKFGGECKLWQLNWKVEPTIFC